MSERDRLHLAVAYDDATTAASFFLPVPEGGTVTKITACIGLALTGDLTITAEIATVAVTGSSIVFTAAGSAAGDVEEAEPTAANVIPADGALEIIFDGTPSAGGSVVVHVEIERNV